MGWFSDTSARIHGFLLSNGSYTPLDVPGAVDGTEAYGINDAGEIVGTFNDGNQSHGFAFSNGPFTSIDFPNATGTFAYGVNASGQIVGAYSVGSRFNGFELTGKTFKSLEVPHSSQTYAFGINKSDDISGYFFDKSGEHGFLARNGTLQVLDFPGAGGTTGAAGLNDKDIVVGTFTDPSIQKVEGFITNGVTYHELKDPNGTTTFPSGINNSNVIGGIFFNSLGDEMAFVATP